jgi:hypothetical protein
MVASCSVASRPPLRGCSLRSQVLTRPARDARGITSRFRETEVSMLRIYADALEVVRELVPYVAQIDRHDTDLARQLKKARSSIPLNVAEVAPGKPGRRKHELRSNCESP